MSISPSSDWLAAVAEESRRIRRVKVLVALTEDVLRHGRLTRAEAASLIDHLRAEVLRLFPEGGETFDILYARRLCRLVEARFPSRPGGVQGERLPA
jgi:hypothetical protein